MTEAIFKFGGPENFTDLFEQAVAKFKDNKHFRTNSQTGDGND